MLCALVALLSSMQTLFGPPATAPTSQTSRQPGLSAHTVSRRHFLGALGAVATLPSAAVQADEPRLWISGKSDPIRKTNPDKPDGTKKDPKYLSCLNDCVPRCIGAPGQVQKERLDCLLICQDECCSTYQQCTYTIRQ